MMTRSQAITKLTKLFAMMSTMASNREEAIVAKKRFDELAAKFRLSISDLLGPSNPNRELVRSIVRQRQQTVRKIRELSQFAVDEWKRQSEVSLQWWERERARIRAPNEAIDFSSNPAKFSDAKRAAAQAKALGDYHFISSTALGLSEDSQTILLKMLSEIAWDEQFSKNFEDHWI